MSSRGGYGGGAGRGSFGGAGRGSVGGHRPNQRQEQSFDLGSWPTLPSSSGRGVSVSGGICRGNARRENDPVVSGDRKPSSSSPPSSGVVSAGDVASSSSAIPVRGKSKVSESDSASALSQELAKKVQITPPAPAVQIPGRPGNGEKGDRVWIRANHFRVTFENKKIYHYNVSISPDEVNSEKVISKKVISKKVIPKKDIPKKVNRDVLKALVNTYKVSNLGSDTYAYDGRNSLYTAHELPFESNEFAVDLNDNNAASSSSSRKKERKFKVTIKLASRLDLHHLGEFLEGKPGEAPNEVVQALDVVLRHWPSQNCVTVGRSFFDLNPDQKDLRLGKKGTLDNGVEYCRGYFQSLRLTKMGLSLNLDVSTTTFYEKIYVNEFIRRYLEIKNFGGRLKDSDRVKVKKALMNVKVDLQHFNSKRSAKISGISSLPMKDLSFTLDGKSKIRVETYFSTKYKCQQLNNSLPAVESGSDSRLAYFPMELCQIAKGQRYTKKLNSRQVSTLVNATSQGPVDREKKIKEMVTNDNYNNIPLVRNEFGMSVANELALFEARVLPPPKLRYHESGKGKYAFPMMGQWNMDRKKMFDGARVDSWACVNFSTTLNTNFAQTLCNDLIQTCIEKGMQFGQPVTRVISCLPKMIEEKLRKIHEDSPGLQLLIVILPDTAGYSYGKIKRVCETELGIVSQCCRPQQISKRKKQYMENLALKINVKTGGRNTVLDDAITRSIPKITNDHRHTIIMGADVTHPQPGEDSSPSIAAVVASMDWPGITKYRALMSSQKCKQEIIEDLHTLIREHINAFKKATGERPERIIFYRDGVSEGQFNQVLSHEVNAIRNACESIDPGYRTPITFVVVQKRHHTRLFPTQEGGCDPKSGNILPGTVVDTTICHPTQFDFYLNSHAGIKGTSRPAHYHVLLDENDFSADELQTFTNNICYTYARCTRAVSIVPPAYYAHLAAFRARYYLESEMSDGGSSKSRNTATSSTSDVVSPLPAIKDNVKNVMFFC